MHDPVCFKCTFCPTALDIKDTCVWDEWILCRVCYDRGSSRICGTCGDPVFDIGVRMGNVTWHTEHFVCASCKQALKPTTCVLTGNVLKCKVCAAEDRIRCSGCGLAVQDTGIRACGALYHKDCCTCQFCKKALGTGQVRFVNIRAKPACAECFQRLRDEGRIDNHGRLVMLGPDGPKGLKRKKKVKSSSKD